MNNIFLCKILAKDTYFLKHALIIFLNDDIQFLLLKAHF